LILLSLEQIGQLFEVGEVFGEFSFEAGLQVGADCYSFQQPLDARGSLLLRLVQFVLLSFLLEALHFLLPVVLFPAFGIQKRKLLLESI